MENDHFLAKLDEFIRVTNKIISKLKSELEWMKKHHQRCNTAKTVGTTATVAGATVVVGSLLLAPFTGNCVDETSTKRSYSPTSLCVTGGVSLVAATGYGFGTGAAGAAVNITTDITDLITTKLENSEIRSICNQRNDVANRLKNHFDELQRVALELRRLNVEETAAYALSLKNLVSKGNSIRASAANIVQLSRCAGLASGTSNMLLRGGGKFWQSMRLQSETLMSLLGYFGFNVTRRGAMAVVRSGTAMLSGVFAIYDVYSLIKSVTNDHPTTEAIDNMIKQMNKELTQIKDLRSMCDQFI